MGAALKTRDDGNRDATDARELAWINAIAQGDRIAFERLYTSYHGLLARFLTKFTSRRDLIDEVVNESMWAVWRSADRFRGDSKPRTWIIAIAYRTLMKAVRDQRAEPSRSAAQHAEHDSIVEILDTSSEPEQTELRDWVRHGLALLPDEQRTTIELAYFLGQSCEEIAEIMNCAVGTVKARMFHARVRLRNSLPSLGGESGPETRSELA